MKKGDKVRITDKCFVESLVGLEGIVMAIEPACANSAHMEYLVSTEDTDYWYTEDELSLI
jgi:hypothetical protein